MYIKPTSNAKEGSIFSVHPGADEMLLYTRSEQTPTPWDSDISISGGRVVLSGFMAPGGPPGKPICRCEFDIADFDRYYYLEIPNDIDDYDDVVKAVLDAGWVETKGFN